MFDAQTILMFVLAATALALAPGPDNIFVLTQSALYGRVSGWWVTLGLCTGLLVHSALAALGIAALVASSVFAYNGLKLVGACYLLYLAWGAWRAKPVQVHEDPSSTPSLPPDNQRAMYLRGLIMNVSNPKVGIFFLAFLPGFADAGTGPVAWRMLVLGGWFIGVTLVVFGTVAWGAGFVGRWLRHSPRGQVLINRVAALVFVGLAAHLLFG